MATPDETSHIASPQSILMNVTPKLNQYNTINSRYVSSNISRSKNSKQKEQEQHLNLN